MASVRPEVPAKFNPIRPVRASSWAGMAPVRPEASSKLKDIMPVRAPSWVGMGPVWPKSSMTGSVISSDDMGHKRSLGGPLEEGLIKGGGLMGRLLLLPSSEPVQNEPDQSVE
eukprot:556718-Prorocentrum_minimum.AAC.1